jgi:hypothetical protein
MTSKDFHLTQHAIARLKERFPAVIARAALLAAPALRIKMLYEILWDTATPTSTPSSC